MPATITIPFVPALSSNSNFHLIFISLPYNRGMQILIVEDEAKIRHFLRRGLLEESYAVDTAEDGEEALYKLDINAYDLVLLDILLPKVNGIAVCQALRAKGSHVPIILLTAKDQVTDKVLGLDARADDYLTKPFSFPWKRPSLPPLSSWLGDFHRRTLYRPQRSERRFLRFGQASNAGDVHPLVEPVSHPVHALACPYIPAENGSVLTCAQHHPPIGAKDHCPYPARMTV